MYRPSSYKSKKRCPYCGMRKVIKKDGKNYCTACHRDWED